MANNTQIPSNPFTSDKQWDNLKDKDVNVINSLKKQIISAAEGSIAEVDYLKSALQLYKQAVLESIDSNMEAADIIAKYSTGAQLGGMSGSYNLPGVFSAPEALYDTNAMKADNEKLLQTNNVKNNADKQKDMYFKMVVQNYNDLKQRLNALAQTNQQIFIYLSQLNDTFQN